MIYDIWASECMKERGMWLASVRTLKGATLVVKSFTNHWEAFNWLADKFIG